MPRLISCLRDMGFAMCAVYCTDATFLHDAYKYCAAHLAALCCMNQLALPHWNVLTKCDLVGDKEKLDEILTTELQDLMPIRTDENDSRFARLNEKMCDVLTNSSMVQFVTLDHTDEETIQAVLYSIDSSLGYFEGQEPRMADIDM